jgi:VanZ family protein
MVIYKMQRSIIPIIYFICISVLFFLPGSAFPKSNWFSAIYMDKWVHIVLFFGLAFLCCWGFSIVKQKHLIKLLVLFTIYGLIVEIIQDQIIKNRSFDLGDWAADVIGSSLGLIWNLGYIKRVYKKR